MGCAPYRDHLFTIEDQGGAGEPSRVTPTPVREAGAAAKPAPTAGSGGTVPAAGVGGSGTDTPPGLDPSVSFDWPATVPGAGLCRPISFSGSYSCKVETLFVSDRLEGSLQLSLKGSSESQQLSVSGGQVLAFDQDRTSLLTAMVTSGTLDCSQQLLNVTYGPAPTDILTVDRQVGWLVGKPQPMVTVTLKGNLDRDGQTIKGEMTLSFEAPSETTCDGTFSMRAIL